MGIKDTLPDFQSFLRSGKLAPAKNISYLAHWASRFLFFIAGKNYSDPGALIIEFLDSLKSRENIAEWQIRQAPYPPSFRTQADSPRRKDKRG